MKGVPAFIALGLLAGACSSPAVRVGPLPRPDYRTIGPARGGAGSTLLFGFIPIGVNERTQRAYDRAVANGRGTALIDTQVRDRWYYIYVGELLCTDVEGTAVE